MSGGVLPLTSISYTAEKINEKGRDSASATDPGRVWHARSRHRFSIPSGEAGTNLRKTARYAGKNCDPLHAAPKQELRRSSPQECDAADNTGVLLPAPGTDLSDGGNDKRHGAEDFGARDYLRSGDAA